MTPGSLLQAASLILLLATAEGADAQDSIPAADSAGIRRGTVVKAAALTSGYYAGSLFVLGKTWYRGRDGVPFHFYDDTRAYLQVDKLGHAFGAYVYSYAGYHWLLHAGLSRTEALLFGATLGLVLQTPIEIMDGIHEGYGFSWGDMAANALGSGLVAGQALAFGDQVVKYKFSYRPSRYADLANGYLGTTPLDRLLEDYNGHTYWLSVPIGRLVPQRDIPRWLSVAAGYGADGMIGEFENLREYDGVAIPELRRRRRFLLSLDVDWTRIETDSRVLRTVLTGLAYVKLPFPAVQVDSDGRWRGWWMYW